VGHSFTGGVFCCLRSTPRGGLVGRRPQLTVEERFGDLERALEHALLGHGRVPKGDLYGEAVDERREHQCDVVWVRRSELARSLALAPDAIAARDQIARTLLHLLDAGPSSRLAASRELIELATAMDRTLERSAAEAAGSTTEPSSGGRSGRGRSGSKRATRPGAGMAAVAEPPDDGQDDATDGDGDGPAAPAASASAAQRRRAAASIVGLWRDLARDLVVAGLGVEREVRDPGLLDDLRDAATLLGAGPHAAQDAGDRAPDPVAARLTAFLGRLDAAGELLEANVRPELVVDTLLLHWPRTGLRS